MLRFGVKGGPRPRTDLPNFWRFYVPSLIVMDPHVNDDSFCEDDFLKDECC